MPEGETKAELVLVAKAAGGPVTLTATHDGRSRDAQVTVLAADHVPALISLEADKSEVDLMEPVTFTLELDVPAPPVGVSVSLSSSGQADLEVPASVVVVGGKRRATFEATAGDATGPVTVKATLGESFVEASVVVRRRPDVGILLVEVFPDALGQDGGKEWVKLYNGTYESVNLSGYSLGYGGSDYTWGTFQLEGSVAAGECFVVGGPTSDDTNHRPALDQASEFQPNIQNGGEAADGLALFALRADQITAESVPVDALVYGPVNSSSLIGADGEPVAVPHTDVPWNGNSLVRTGVTTWGYNETPNDRGCVQVP